MHITHGVTCNVGYAEFVVESVDPINLTLSGVSSGVCGRSGSLFLGLVPPFDPSTKAVNTYKNEFSKLPSDHPLRHKLTGPGTTFLDFEIYIERSLPNPFWKIVFQNQTAFTLNMIPLVLKASDAGLGMHSVHTFHTDETRGLIRVGKTPVDLSTAHVYFENRSGTQGVGMMIELFDKKESDIMKVLPSMLKSFRFTVANLDSDEDARRLIMQAGVFPKSEVQEREWVQQGGGEERR